VGVCGQNACEEADTEPYQGLAPAFGQLLGYVPSVTCKVVFVPCWLLTTTGTLWPGFNSASTAESTLVVEICWPSTDTIVSPTRSPAFAAGPPAFTEPTYAVPARVARTDAEIGAVRVDDLAVRHSHAARGKEAPRRLPRGRLRLPVLRNEKPKRPLGRVSVEAFILEGQESEI
jgi:hypothetical protein